MNSLEERVRQVIADRLSISEDLITPGAKFAEDLGADSLDTIEVVIGLEDEFEIDISEEEAEQIVTFGDMLDFIKAHAGQYA